MVKEGYARLLRELYSEDAGDDTCTSTYDYELNRYIEALQSLRSTEQAEAWHAATSAQRDAWRS